MKTPASVARHPIHPMLVTIPIGLWVFSLVCDIVAFFTAAAQAELLWFMLAYYTMAGGIVGALLAAIPGLIDLLSLKNRSLRKLAVTHLAINLAVIALYALNLWLRMETPVAYSTAVALSVLGILMILTSGWIGAEMVHVHGVSVSGVPEPVADEPSAEPVPRLTSSEPGLGPT